jgi:hypothetical protein
MERFIGQHFVPLIAALTLVSQAVTVVTIRHIAPRALMMHPKARRFRTLADVLYLALCFAPYYNSGLGVALLIFSLLYSASILRNAWSLRALGEAASVAIFDSAVRRTSTDDLLWSVAGSAACVGAVSFVMFVLSPRPTMWGYWAAVGVAYYAIGGATTQSVSIYRAFKRNRLNAPTTERDGMVAVGD